jgi:hypothetical protein
MYGELHVSSAYALNASPPRANNTGNHFSGRMVSSLSDAALTNRSSIDVSARSVRKNYSAGLQRQYRSFGVLIHGANRVIPCRDDPPAGDSYRRRAAT